MAIAAVAGFVTTGAQLRIGTCRQGVGYVKIAGVNVVHIVAEAAHLIGKPGCVAFQAFILLMAGGAVDAVALGFIAMAKRPGCAVGFQARIGYLFNHGRIVTPHTHIIGGDNGFALLHMTAGAVVAAEDLDMFVVIKWRSPDRGCHQHDQNGQTKH